ncbi:YtxH domain-containing protein [Fulvivirga lutea]|uniref:YtxH domain-containing protein n=1 Tax=Fulvivirga lutea TaxID=2810512 RepID=A0A974WGS5_9BACT|nr:YtxH domain-containing protein [Fulvivirga lutea]QSE97403.1 YtxH domain-containing protein [Fulvivirga lutea]
MNNGMKTALSFVTGITAGAILGILTAPESGKKTRKRIVDEIDSTRATLEDLANEKLDEAKKLINWTAEEHARDGHRAIEKTKDKVKVS